MMQYIGNQLKHNVIITDLTTYFQQAWSIHVRKTVSSDVVCFSSGKCLLSSSQMKADNKKGVGTLTYYSIEALDCPTLIISKAHAK